jgi:two-component system, OmpR family, alkaline phosphatase synthesis response regulator PhoP
MTPPPAGDAAAVLKRRTLVVEDEAPIREVVRLHLELAGFDVTQIGDGRRALDLARSTRFDVIVLDLMLPGVDGITLCRAIRAEGANTLTPILMLTARDTEADTVLGLESGADDYMTKPFGTRELVARVTALLRRQDRLTQRSEEPTRVVSRSGVAVDADRRRVTVRGDAVELTKQEFDLLQLLIMRPGIVFSREALIAKVWGGDTYITDRTVDTVVSVSSRWAIRRRRRRASAAGVFEHADVSK